MTHSVYTLPSSVNLLTACHFSVLVVIEVNSVTLLGSIFGKRFIFVFVIRALVTRRHQFQLEKLVCRVDV